MSTELALSEPSSKALILAPQLTLGDIIQKDGTLRLSEQALRDKEDILAESRPCTTPATQSEFTASVNIAARIRGIMKSAEIDRESAKAPFLAIGRAIDASAKRYSAELDAELKRLDRLNGDYEFARREEERKRAEAAAAETRRLAHEVERKRLEAEAASEKERKRLDTLAAKGKEPTAAEKAATLTKQLEIAEEQEKLEEKQRQLQEQQMADVEKARQAKPSSGSQRMQLNVTVFDARALHAFRADCVKLEPDLTQIKYLINSGITTIPGVNWTRTPVFSSTAR